MFTDHGYQPYCSYRFDSVLANAILTHDLKTIEEFLLQGADVVNSEWGMRYNHIWEVRGQSGYGDWGKIKYNYVVREFGGDNDSDCSFDIYLHAFHYMLASGMKDGVKMLLDYGIGVFNYHTFHLAVSNYNYGTAEVMLHSTGSIDEIKSVLPFLINLGHKGGLDYVASKLCGEVDIEVLEHMEVNHKSFITLFKNFPSHLKIDPYLDPEEEMDKLVKRVEKLLLADENPVDSLVLIAALKTDKKLFDLMFEKATNPELLQDLLTYSIYQQDAEIFNALINKGVVADLYSVFAAIKINNADFLGKLVATNPSITPEDLTQPFNIALATKNHELINMVMSLNPGTNLYTIRTLQNDPELNNPEMLDYAFGQLKHCKSHVLSVFLRNELLNNNTKDLGKYLDYDLNVDKNTINMVINKIIEIKDYELMQKIVNSENLKSEIGSTQGLIPERLVARDVENPLMQNINKVDDSFKAIEDYTMDHSLDYQL